MALKRIVIVGASLAGLRAAMTLREDGFAGSLVVVGEEARMPYDRPPLSKQILSGEWTPQDTALPFDSALLDADWRLGRRAVSLNVGERRIELDDGSSEPFDGLIIATGAVPRSLGEPRLAGVHTLRTLDDAVALEADLRFGRGPVVVVGGGFIGAEVAATCRRRGLEVTIAEALPAPLSRALGPEVGALMASIHRDRGVEVRVGVSVRRVVGARRVEQVELSDGTSLAAGVVLVAVGVRPATDWLEGSGLALDDGVICDETCSVAPGIVAAGDVARWPSRRSQDVRRIEHWDNATRQAEHAARRLLAGSGPGGAGRYDPVPWVWSDQYELKLQLAGSPTPHDEVRVVVSTSDERRVLAFYRRGERLVAGLGINRARLVLQLRTMLDNGISWEEATPLFEAAAA
jgi:3-phenylpropionate/trans-cinnamate dioxygenase ferredoxin reductase component